MEFNINEIPDLTKSVWVGFVWAIILTPIAATIVVRLYRRSVRRVMNRLSPDLTGSSAAPISGSAHANNKPVKIEEWKPTDANQSTVQLAAVRRRLRQQTVLYSTAGLCYALVFTITRVIRDDDPTPTSFLLFLLAYLFPTLIAIYLIRGYSTTAALKLIGSYVLVAVLVLGSLIAFGASFQVLDSAVSLFVFVNVPAGLTVLFFLRRRVSSVTYLLFPFILLAGIGSAGAVYFLRDSLPYVMLLRVTGFLACGLLGLLLLRLLSWLYVEKRFSLQMLTLDVMFFVFAFLHALSFIGDMNNTWLVALLAAYAGYKAIVLVGLLLIRRRNGGNEKDPPAMLLLRLFSLRDRSERFLDRFARLWLQAGNINMIAGPDLASRLIGPQELFLFIVGRLSSLFIPNRESLHDRLAQYDNEPDPDDRYRIAEYFCFDNTWRMTMQLLADQSSVVLMDLRSLRPESGGLAGLSIVDEIYYLLQFVSLDKVLFLIDDTTDEDYFRKLLFDKWTHVVPGSPNLDNPSPRIQFFRGSRKASSHALELLELLLNKSA